jgi:hypothetical protein
MTATASTLRLCPLLPTGAAGSLGCELRPRLRTCCETLRISHRGPFGPAGKGEEVVLASLEDKAAMRAPLEGVDAVVHMGGVSTERQTLAVALYHAVFAAGVRAPQSIDAMAMLYMDPTLRWLLIALRLVNPIQLVSRVKEHSAHA